MHISTFHLLIAAQITLVLVCLIAYLIYMLISEGKRWDSSVNKLQTKIRNLKRYKDQFEGVFSKLEKETIKRQALEVEASSLKNEAREKSTALKKNIKMISDLREKLKAFDQLNPKLFNAIESLENENEELSIDLAEARESLTQFKHQANLISDELNIELGAVKEAGGNSALIQQQGEELKRLKKSYDQQKEVISELEETIIEVQNNPDSELRFNETSIANFKQKLTESNTVIEMLEGEINTLQGKINYLVDENTKLAIAGVQGGDEQAPLKKGVVFGDEGARLKPSTKVH